MIEQGAKFQTESDVNLPVSEKFVKVRSAERPKGFGCDALGAGITLDTIVKEQTLFDFILDHFISGLVCG